MSADTQLNDSEAQFVNDFAQLFNQLPLIPSTPIRTIDNHDWAEDGLTLIVSATLADGTVLHISLMPGRPLGVSLHDVGIRYDGGVHRYRHEPTLNRR